MVLQDGVDQGTKNCLICFYFKKWIFFFTFFRPFSFFFGEHDFQALNFALSSCSSRCLALIFCLASLDSGVATELSRFWNLNEINVLLSAHIVFLMDPPDLSVLTSIPLIILITLDCSHMCFKGCGIWIDLYQILICIEIFLLLCCYLKIMSKLFIGCYQEPWGIFVGFCRMKYVICTIKQGF